MDKLYRQLFSLDVASLKIVCDSAIYIRNWHDKHDGKDNDISEQDAHAPEMWRYSPGEKHRPQRREGAHYTPTEKEEIEKVIAILLSISRIALMRISCGQISWASFLEY